MVSTCMFLLTKIFCCIAELICLPSRVTIFEDILLLFEESSDTIDIRIETSLVRCNFGHLRMSIVYIQELFVHYTRPAEGICHTSAERSLG